VPDPETSLGARTSGNDRTHDDSQLEQLTEELESAREEILRLRDLLIGKDAELGLVKGQLAELEHRMGRWSRLAARPELRRLVSAADRKIRRLRNPSR
jgi:hypothetical protein